MAMPCSICTHSQRDAINQALVSGRPNRRIASEYHTSEASLRRHKKNGHIPAQVTQAGITQQHLEADRLLAVMEKLLGEAISAVHNAREKGDERTRIQAVRAAADINRTLLEIAGEFQTGNKVQVNVGIQSITNAPEWPVLMRVLTNHPEIRGELSTALLEAKL